MTEQERKTVGEFWFGLAQMYGKEISRISMKIMLDAVSDLPANDVLRSLGDWSRTSKQNRHPLPGEVRDSLTKELSVESKANEAANRIRSAISRFGWSNHEDAMAFIGELGWAIVERFGGWLYICENHGDKLSPLTFHAQARDTAKSLIEQESLGVLNDPISLISSGREQVSGGLVKISFSGLLEKNKKHQLPEGLGD